MRKKENMIVNNGRDRLPATILFLHIPKSGGTTFKYFLQQSWRHLLTGKEAPEPPGALKYFYDSGIFYYPIGFFKDPAGTTALSKSLIDALGQQSELVGALGHFSFGFHQHLNSPCTYITFLRDPVERVISLYYHLVVLEILDREVSLEEFVSDCPVDGWLEPLQKWYPPPAPFSEAEIRKAAKCLPDNDQTRRISGMDPPFGGCTETMLDKACQHLDQYFSFIGITERFDESILLFNGQFSWAYEIHYLPELVNPRRPSSRQIPEATRQLIEQRNHFDRRLYEYAWNLFEQRTRAKGEGFQAELEQFRNANNRFIDANRETMAKASAFPGPDQENE